jgi:uncharacterized protein (TIGR02246 family)
MPMRSSFGRASGDVEVDRYHCESELEESLMSNSGLLPALAVTSLLLLGCTTRESPTREVFLAEESVRALSRQWQDLWHAGDTSRVAALLAEDVVFLRAHTDPLMGPAAVKTFMTQHVGSRRETWEPTSVLVAPSLDVVVERGTYGVRGAGQSGMAAIGNYVSVYHRTSGGWKVQTDAKWLTDVVAGDSLCRVTSDGTGRHVCRRRAD